MELGTTDDFPIFFRDFWTGDDMNAATQHLTRNDFCWRSSGIDSGRDDYVGIEND